jgi:hypothetical protein
MQNMNSKVQADAVRRAAAEALADKHLTQHFDAPLTNLGSESLDEQVATGDFSPIVTMLKAYSQGLEQREGYLIQEAVTLALQSKPGLIVLPTLRVNITDADRKLVDGNRYADLSELAPPHAGDEVGCVEVDAVVANRAKSELFLIDIKRFPRDKDKDVSRLKEASLATTRRLSRQGLYCNSTAIIVVRWWGEPMTAFGSTIATPETVDDLLGAPVRETVEAALYKFKAGVNERVVALVARVTGMITASDAKYPVGACLTMPDDNLEALRRALSSDRIGRRA